MTDIADYFTLPDTHRTYSKGLALFMAYLAASSPQLTAQLIQGPFGTNQAVLDNALLPLKDFATLKSKSLPPSVAAVTREDATPVAITERTLANEKRAILQRRARTSQRFHTCNTDAERALICDAIDEVDAELEKCIGDIEFFRLHGFPPPPPKEGETDDVQLPKNREELDQMRARLASRQYKLRRRVGELLELPDNSLKRAGIPKKRKELHKCTELLDRVKAAIAKTPK